MKDSVFKVPGMSCGHCKAAIAQAVGRLAGVAAVEVDLAAKRVTVRYDPGFVTEDRIKEAIEDEGYDVAELL